MSLINLEVSNKKNLFFNRFLALFFILAMIWSTFESIEEFEQMMDRKILPNEKIENRFEMRDLKLSKTEILTKNRQEVVLYITSKDLQYTASNSKQAQIISSNFGFTKMIGLESFASFLISNKHESFWRSQFYIEIIFHYGGLALLFVIFFVYGEVNFRQGKKLFTKEIKWLVFAINILIFISFLGEMIIYGRMISYLNKEFYISEPLVGGASQELLWLFIALLFLIMFIEKAIPLQQELELTV